MFTVGSASQHDFLLGKILTMIDDIEQHIYKLTIGIYKLFWEIFRHVYWKDIIEVDLRRLLQEVNLF